MIYISIKLQFFVCAHLFIFTLTNWIDPVNAYNQYLYSVHNPLCQYFGGKFYENNTSTGLMTSCCFLGGGIINIAICL